jgi:hypothetical protein
VLTVEVLVRRNLMMCFQNHLLAFFVARLLEKCKSETYPFKHVPFISTIRIHQLSYYIKNERIGEESVRFIT